MKLFNVINESNSSNFKKLITPDIAKLGNIFKKEGHEIRIVGGAVRDAVLGKTPKDIDLATTATPAEMISLAQNNNLKYIETGLQHGTITVVINGEPYEITTLRIDTETDGRHATVEWTRSFKEDAARRDLTFNAMSIDMQGNLYDYFGGVQDLKKGSAKFVGNTEKRIEEDYLRILRYFRFLGKQPNPSENIEDLNKIKQRAHGLHNISGERIWAELSKILSGNNIQLILTQMQKSGVLNAIGIDKDDFSNAEKTTRLGADPITTLCHLLKNEFSLTKINDRYKLTKKEMQTGIYILAHAEINMKENKWWQERLVLWNDDRSTLIQLALFNHDSPLSQEIEKFTIPTFDVTGKDLIQQGYKPGPQLGQELKRQKQEWFEKMFKR